MRQRRSTGTRLRGLRVQVVQHAPRIARARRRRRRLVLVARVVLILLAVAEPQRLGERKQRLHRLQVYKDAQRRNLDLREPALDMHARGGHGRALGRRTRLGAPLREPRVRRARGPVRDVERRERRGGRVLCGQVRVRDEQRRVPARAVVRKDGHVRERGAEHALPASRLGERHGRGGRVEAERGDGVQRCVQRVKVHADVGARRRSRQRALVEVVEGRRTVQHEQEHGAADVCLDVERRAAIRG